eukprot:6200256-Pleurochrysis_carterae.AAC.1
MYRWRHEAVSRHACAHPSMAGRSRHPRHPPFAASPIANGPYTAFMLSLQPPPLRLRLSCSLPKEDVLYIQLDAPSLAPNWSLATEVESFTSGNISKSLERQARAMRDSRGERSWLAASLMCTILAFTPGDHCKGTELMRCILCRWHLLMNHPRSPICRYP